ncbi:CGNR zinc finger domain-containing protein [Pseudolysinimonas kribbensis]|uniref:Zinc finger CGNR domain-containing protein n=1 Tax=Pseudolysinimonas kribbensis TaxID=433641 RepID=A0ABQ6K293_9MICO|nr:CGNR zinc finger domain-containing protein [Pseudolysinimonas kribbensis]GMA94721.1 hypothetical protein GCM10025881_15450 [Pseudolysinimonas kribbensis]
MTWSATARYGTDAAPGQLAFVHDFLSTAPVGHPALTDLLDDLGPAQSWLDEAVRARGADPAEVKLGSDDLAPLKRLRSALLTSLDGEADVTTSAPSAKLSISLDANGSVQLDGEGGAAARLTATLLRDVYDAQQQGTWRRLKACRNPSCRIVFFDRSKNNSRVWDDLATCGNREHLRTFRARQRAMESEGDAGSLTPDR